MRQQAVPLPVSQDRGLERCLYSRWSHRNPVAEPARVKHTLSLTAPGSQYTLFYCLLVFQDNKDHTVTLSLSFLTLTTFKPWSSSTKLVFQRPPAFLFMNRQLGGSGDECPFAPATSQRKTSLNCLTLEIQTEKDGKRDVQRAFKYSVLGCHNSGQILGSVLVVIPQGTSRFPVGRGELRQQIRTAQVSEIPPLAPQPSASPLLQQ